MDNTTELNATALIKRALLNATAVSPSKWPENTVIPWDDQEAMNEIFALWMRFEHLPPAKTILIGVATGFYLLLLVLFSYSFWCVFCVIAMTETPQPVLNSDSDSALLKKSDDVDEKTLVKYEWPYTDSLRKMFRHLTRQAGYTAVFRGIVCLVFLMITTDLGVGALVHWTQARLDIYPSHGPDAPAAGFKTKIARFVVEVIVQMLVFTVLAPWNAAQTHIVTTTHSYRTWVRRIPRFVPTVKATWLVYAVFVFITQVDEKGRRFLSGQMGVAGVSHPSTAYEYSMFILLAILHWAFQLSIKFPAVIVLKRINLSLLPEGEETLIPVDLSFSTERATTQKTGYAPPGILAKPRAPITARHALKSLFQDATYKHLLILFAKGAAIELGLDIVAWPFLGSELTLPGWKWSPGPGMI